MRRIYSLVVDKCCQVHHRPDDGGPDAVGYSPVANFKRHVARRMHREVGIVAVGTRSDNRGCGSE
ncbi:hypothetical protein DIPPA_35368 [Diplonema papillatum]|nr:hypothetical protein DIPPA_35368 [Diplonema papillatum]